MHRSASWNFMHQSPNVTPGLRMSSSMDENELPVYDPIIEMAKKEKKNKVAENAIHVIPFVLIICGFVLWFFSNPDVEVGGIRGDSIAARIEGLTIEGDTDTDSDGTQTGLLPVDLGDMEPPKSTKDHKRFRKLVHKLG